MQAYAFCHQSVQAGPGFSCWLDEQLSIHHWLPLEYPLQKHNHNSKGSPNTNLAYKTHHWFHYCKKSYHISYKKKLPTQTSVCRRYKK